MPPARVLKYCVALSVLFHLLIAGLASLVPFTPRPAEDVMVVDLADLPRSTDFLPPKPGLVEGKRPEPPPPRERPPRKEMPPERPSGALRGPVPDLPVDPALQPEKEFPEPRAPKESPQPRPKEPDARTAERAQDAKEAPPQSEAPAGRGPRRSLRDLTPSLGKMVMARRDSGAGRGQDDSRGTAAGTDAKARGKGDIAEERGGGSYLKALGTPELQYISYLAGIKRKIDLVWGYPPEAQVAGLQGQVVIDFVIGPQGQVASVTVVSSSGHAALDDAAKRAIRVAAPYNPVPAEYKERYKTSLYPVRGYFTYTIQNVNFR